MRLLEGNLVLIPRLLVAHTGRLHSYSVSCLRSVAIGRLLSPTAYASQTLLPSLECVPIIRRKNEAVDLLSQFSRGELESGVSAWSRLKALTTQCAATLP